MANCKNKCKTCDYCKRLYTMFGFKFWRSKKYFCAQQNKPISVYDGCEKWAIRKTEYDLSLQRFDAVQNDINALLFENIVCD